MACMNSKTVFHITNFLYGVLGLVIFVLSITFIHFNAEYLLDPNRIAEALFGHGLFVMTVSLIGSIALSTKCEYLLKMTAIMLMVVSFLIGFLTVQLFRFGVNVESSVEKGMKLTFTDAKEIDELQKFLQCCGINGPSFWEKDQLPNTCCSSLTECLKNSTDLYNDGCFSKFTDTYSYRVYMVGGITIAIFLLGMINELILLCLLPYVGYEFITSCS